MGWGSKIWWTVFDRQRSAWFWTITPAFMLACSFIATLQREPGGGWWLLPWLVALPLGVMNTRRALRSIRRQARPLSPGYLASLSKFDHQPDDHS